MDAVKAKEIIKEYQAWRLGADTPQLNPKIITEAIDIILLEFKPKRKIKRKIIYTKTNLN
jgi:hypothetical protein